MFDENQFLSPEKKDTVLRLREQEISLDMQGQAIQEMLVKLDKSFLNESKVNHLEQKQIFHREALPKASLSNNMAGFHEHKDTGDTLITQCANELQASKEQLQYIRDRRTIAIQQRVKQHTDALNMMVIVRQQAIEHARKEAAAALAVRHHSRRHGWILLQQLQHNVALHNKIYAAIDSATMNRLQKTLCRLINWLQVVGRSSRQLRTGASFHAWRLFRRQHTAQQHTRLREMRGQIAAHQHLIHKHCRRVVKELLRATQRLRMTTTRMDLHHEQYSLRSAFRRMRKHCKERHTVLFAVFNHLNAHQINAKRSHLERLRSFAVRAERARRTAAQWNARQKSKSLQTLLQYSNNRMYLDNALRNGESFHYFRAVGGALSQWRRFCSRRRKSLLAGKVAHRAQQHQQFDHSNYLQRSAVKIFSKWLHLSRISSMARLLSRTKVLRLAFKLLHFWRQTARIRAIVRRKRKALVRHHLLRGAWQLLLTRLRATAKSRALRRQARRVAHGTAVHKQLSQAFENLLVFAQRRRDFRHRHSRRLVVSRVSMKREYFTKLARAVRSHCCMGVARRHCVLKAYSLLVNRLRARAALKLKKKSRRALNDKQLSTRDSYWAKWLLRTQVVFVSSRRYDSARALHTTALLRRGLLDWMQHTAAVASRAYLTPSRVPESWARRALFLRKWVAVTTTNSENRAFLTTVRRYHAKCQAKRVFSILREHIAMQQEARKAISDYREFTQVPLLQHRVFRTLRALVRLNNRTRQRQDDVSHAKLRRAVTWWKAIHSTHRSSTVDESKAQEHCAQRQSVHALKRWGERWCAAAAQSKSMALSKRFNGMVLSAPALHMWKFRVDNRLQRKEARSLASKHILACGWAKVQANCHDQVSARRIHKERMQRGRLLHALSLTSRHFDVFVAHSRKRLAFRAMKMLAKSVQTSSLLMRTFQQLRQFHHEMCVLPVRQMVVRWVAQSCKRVFRRLKKLVARKTVLVKAQISRTAFVCKRTLARVLVRRRQECLALKRIMATGQRHFKLKRFDSHMLLWWQFVAARRTVNHAERLLIRQQKLDRREQLLRHFLQFQFRRVVKSLKVNSYDRKCDRSDFANTQRVMCEWRSREALREWVHVARRRVVTKELVSACIAQIREGKALSVFPALASNSVSRKNMRVAKEFSYEKALKGAWRSWKRFAHILVKRKRVSRRRLRKKCLSFTSDITDFWKDGATVDFTAVTDFSETLTVMSEAPGADAEYYVEHCGDFRVSVQRKQIVDAEKAHLKHAKLAALRLWLTFSREKAWRSRVVAHVTFRRYRKLFRRLRNLPAANDAKRSAVRKSWKAFCSVHYKRVFGRLSELCSLNQMTRLIENKSLAACWKVWKAAHSRVAAVRQGVDIIQRIFDRHSVLHAFSEWARGTVIDRTATHHVQDTNNHKCSSALTTLNANRRARKKRRFWLLRSRRHKTDRWRRKVFTNLLDHIERKYNSVDQLKAAHQWHISYQVRNVLQNLQFLKRNQIARDFCMRKQSVKLMAAMRVNVLVSQFQKEQLITGRLEITRKLFAKFVSRTKQLRAKHIHRRIRAIMPVGGRNVRASQALSVWSHNQLMTRYLSYFKQYVRFSRRSSKLLVNSNELHKRHSIFRAFRKLLSFNRMRKLKRRTVEQLAELQKLMHKRRALSRLDTFVAYGWSRTQEDRLMDIHSQNKTYQRGLRAIDGVCAVLRAERRAKAKDSKAGGEEKEK